MPWLWGHQDIALRPRGWPSKGLQREVSHPALRLLAIGCRSERLKRRVFVGAQFGRAGPEPRAVFRNGVLFTGSQWRCGGHDGNFGPTESVRCYSLLRDQRLAAEPRRVGA